MSHLLRSDLCGLDGSAVQIDKIVFINNICSINQITVPIIGVIDRVWPRGHAPPPPITHYAADVQ